MAKIFISYSNKDKELVRSYTDQLKKYGHQILMDTLVQPGDNYEDELMKSLRDADGTIVFLTTNGIQSPNVISEIGIARSYHDSVTNKKFLIPLVSKGIEVPFIIRTLVYLDIEERPLTDTVESIVEAISQFLKKYKLPEPGQNESPTPIPFENLGINSRGEKVKEIQTALNQAGFFKSAIDGIYGQLTEVAVKDFQQNNEITETGEVDKKTYDEIIKIAAAGKGRQADPIEKEGHHEPACWILKINEKNWKISTLKKNFIVNFSTYLNKQEKRPGYKHFQKLHTGDKLLGYAYRELEAIVCIFELAKEIYNHPTEGEVISLKVTEQLNQPISLGSFIDKISFANDFKSAPEKKLFPLSPETFKQILQPSAAIDPVDFVRFNKSSLSEIFTDNPSVEIHDELDFESDINALASVIAYKKVEPPLAIGLFGNWGSGKSFFMNKLEKQIKVFEGMKNDTYCQEVIHVKFNSWHYSDSNLWASLITKIFEDLQKIKKDDSGLETLIKNLNSTKELIADSRLKLGRIEIEKKELEDKKNNTEKEVKEKAQSLASLKVKDIVKIVWENKAVEENVGQIEKLLPGTLINNIAVVKTKVNELSSLGNKIFESIRIIYQFRKGKKPVAILVAFAVFIISCLLLLKYQDASVGFLNWLTIKSAFLVTALTQFAGFLLPAIGKVNTAYKNLKTLETTYTQLEEQERTVYNQELINISNQLEIAKADLKKQEEEITALALAEKQLNNDIDDIIEGKKLNRFIETKASDKRYIDSLGIISWIRKDFEELDFLLKMQNEITDAQIEEMGKKRIKNIFKIDRIILYIDDLDRCNQDIVVRVLEAIHLLLAFPLFVVVVGVDPRWMHNALSLKYKELLRNNSRNKKKHKKEINSAAESGLLNENMEEQTTRPATSYDYLEKIFQIPFVLKTIDDPGKDKLIRSKFEPAQAEKQQEDGEHMQKSTTAIPGINNTEGKTSGGGEQAGNLTQNQGLHAAGNSNLSPGQQTNEKESAGDKGLNKKKLLAQAELLKVSDEEIAFMQGISFIIGDTPRTVNRYINIYRIIRTHSKFEFTSNNELEHYSAAMILLGVVTGMPGSAKQFFEKISAEDDSTAFGAFIQVYIDENKGGEKLLKELISKMGTEESLKSLSNIELEKFKKNLNLISRFTFRNLVYA